MALPRGRVTARIADRCAAREPRLRGQAARAGRGVLTLHAVYVAILAACLIGTLPLELVLHVRVYARWPRLVATLVPVAFVFSVWDVLEIHAGAWRYDPRYLVGVTLPGRLPLEEVLFFLVIPTCAVLTLEAVRVRRPDWTLE